MVETVTRGRLFLLCAALAVVSFTLARRSIVLSDEGYLLAQAQAIVSGKILYRDLDAFVAPGIWLLLAAAFHTFGTSVLVSRWVSLGCLFATAFVVYRTTKRLTTCRHAEAALAAYAVLSVWAFPAWHFAFYSAWSVLFALACLERFVAWDQLGGGWRLVLAGLMAGLSLVFKQNYGAFACLALGLSVLASIGGMRSNIPARLLMLIRSIALVTIGILSALVPVVAYFYFQDALPAVTHSLLVRPFSEFASQHAISFPSPTVAFHPAGFFVGKARLSYEAVPVTATAFSYAAPIWLKRFVEVLHVVLYWAPVGLFIAAAVTLGRRWTQGTTDVGLFSSFGMAGLVFLGVFPRADFNHLINVYQPLILLAAVLVHRFGTHRWHVRSLALVTAPYCLVATLWYVLIMRSMTSPLPMTRGGVMLDPWMTGMLTYEVSEIRNRTVEGEPVLSFPGLSMLNFLAERPMPGPYYNLFAVHIGHDGGRGVVDALEASRPRWLVSENRDYFADDLKMREFAPELMEYLRRNYRQAFGIAIDRHWFLERREVPLPETERIPVLQACGVETGPFATRALRSELLYDSLYHRFRGPGARRESVVLQTTCFIFVPDRAGLTLKFGYRQPDTVNPGTSLRLEILIQSARDPATQSVADSITVPVEPVKSWQSPAPTERLVPLHAWAGQDVAVTFHTILDGDAAPNPLDIEGFAALISDISLEKPEEPGAGDSVFRGDLHPSPVELAGQ